jgi:hypothetical protein
MLTLPRVWVFAAGAVPVAGAPGGMGPRGESTNMLCKQHKAPQ